MNKLTIGKILIFICGLFFSEVVYAQYLPSDWQSSVAAGQGNAFTAWANDGSSIFYNPAGLSLLHNKRSKNIVSDARSPIPDEIEANEQMLNKIQYNPQDWTENLLDSAKANPGKPSYLSMQAFPYLVFGGKNSLTFLIGVPVRSENSAVFLDAASPNNATVNSINTASVAFAIADSTALGGFRWGISVRPNHRTQYENNALDYNGTLSTKSYADTIGDDGTKTTAVALDAGFMATLSDYWFPTIGASVRNIPTGCVDNYIDPITFKLETMCGTVRHGGTDLSPNESRVDPTEVRAGVSVTPRGHIGRNIVNLRLSADVFPIPISSKNKNYGIPSVEPADLVHIGGELFFGSALAKSNFSLRGGYMNQEPTWGGTINLSLLMIGYSSYVATSAVQNSLDVIQKNTERRHMVYLGWQL
ncbi:MAG: hypothetical protein V4591_05110 [Bdellovibrionota bacterium]